MHHNYESLVWVPYPDHPRHAKAVVVLKDGDSAWNPGSTKPERVIYGPALVTYERSPAQIVGYVDDLPEGVTL
jgi:hypothetical protein